jgi:hypothetical protein
MTQPILFAVEDGEHGPATGGRIELSACRKGDVAEALFIAGAQMRNYEVFKPFGHAQTADMCLVKSGSSPMLAQVKTARRDPNRSNSYAINIGKGCSNKRAYSVGDFHVLAAYLPDTNKFVLWSIEDLKGRVTLRYSPEIHRAPDNWELLDEIAATI